MVAVSQEEEEEEEEEEEGRSPIQNGGSYFNKNWGNNFAPHCTSLYLTKLSPDWLTFLCI